MKIYEVQYKCYYRYATSAIPTLRYKYKRKGRLLWEKKSKTPVDSFASHIWAGIYYDDGTALTSSHARMRILQDIIDMEYDGDFEKYVKTMVEYEILDNLMEKEEREEAYHIGLSFLTEGKKKTTVQIGRKEN